MVVVVVVVSESELLELELQPLAREPLEQGTEEPGRDEREPDEREPEELEPVKQLHVFVKHNSTSNHTTRIVPLLPVTIRSQLPVTISSLPVTKLFTSGHNRVTSGRLVGVACAWNLQSRTAT